MDLIPVAWVAYRVTALAGMPTTVAGAGAAGAAGTVVTGTEVTGTGAGSRLGLPSDRIRRNAHHGHLGRDGLDLGHRSRGHRSRGRLRLAMLPRNQAEIGAEIAVTWR